MAGRPASPGPSPGPADPPADRGWCPAPARSASGPRGACPCRLCGAGPSRDCVASLPHRDLRC